MRDFLETSFFIALFTMNLSYVCRSGISGNFYTTGTSKSASMRPSAFPRITTILLCLIILSRSSSSLNCYSYIECCGSSSSFHRLNSYESGIDDKILSESFFLPILEIFSGEWELLLLRAFRTWERPE